LEHDRDRAAAAAGREAANLKELAQGAGEELLGDGARERLAGLAQLLEEVARGRVPGDDVKLAAESLSHGQSLLGEIAGGFNKRLWSGEAGLNQLRDEEQELRRDLESLRNKKFVYDPKVTGLRDLITEQFRRRGQEVAPTVLCELLEVPDEKWQDAVEGWLNTQRFDLIVEPEHFNFALTVYERHKKKHNISGVGLVNTARVIKFLDRQEDGSLAREVRSDNRYALGYVRQLMGNVIKCESEQELKRHRRAITPTCMTYQNNAARQINFKVYETPFIGQRAFARQIERKEARLGVVLAEIKNLTALMGELKALLPRCAGRDSSYILIRERLDVFGKAAATRLAIKEKQAELAAIDSAGIAEIKRKIEQLNEQIKAAGILIEEQLLARGRLEGDIERLVQGRAGLEAAAARAEEDLQLLCAAHPGVVETGEQRYVRERRKKEPGEIAANFLHNRKSMDSQIANKQQELVRLLSDYANRHQFGGRVDAADIEEFKGEYDKLSSSELPEYEAKINQAQQEAEVEFKEHFIFKLRENIENAHTEFGFLNGALKGITFGTDSYRFMVKPSEERDGHYSWIEDYHQLTMEAAEEQPGEQKAAG
jgi:hypothetical protein